MIKFLFKLAILCLMLWGAYEYGQRNCEEGNDLSVEQVKKDLTDMVDDAKAELKEREDSLKYYKEELNKNKDNSDD